LKHGMERLFFIVSTLKDGFTVDVGTCNY